VSPRCSVASRRGRLRAWLAAVPLTWRGGQTVKDEGNRIGVSVMPLNTEIAAPMERLRAIGTGGAKAKAMVGLVGKDLTKHVYDLLPAVASELFTKKVMLPTMNIVVSNVRGPDLPMFLAGALGNPARDAMKADFIDNTDPDGIARTPGGLDRVMTDILRFLPGCGCRGLQRGFAFRWRRGFFLGG